VPTGFRYEVEHGAIAIGGIELQRTKKSCDVCRAGRAAVVVDDLASTDPWRPRGIEIRGAADAVDGPPAAIRIRPERIVSWRLESVGARHARTVDG
jgi:pyridoxamine 5'-phosphate oxidase family protein